MPRDFTKAKWRWKYWKLEPLIVEKNIYYNQGTDQAKSLDLLYQQGAWSMSGSLNVSIAGSSLTKQSGTQREGSTTDWEQFMLEISQWVVLTVLCWEGEVGMRRVFYVKVGREVIQLFAFCPCQTCRSRCTLGTFWRYQLSQECFQQREPRRGVCQSYVDFQYSVHISYISTVHTYTVSFKARQPQYEKRCPRYL